MPDYKIAPVTFLDNLPTSEGDTPADAARAYGEATGEVGTTFLVIDPAWVAAVQVDAVVTRTVNATEVAVTHPTAPVRPAPPKGA